MGFIRFSISTLVEAALDCVSQHLGSFPIIRGVLGQPRCTLCTNHSTPPLQRKVYVHQLPLFIFPTSQNNLTAISLEQLIPLWIRFKCCKVFYNSLKFTVDNSLWYKLFEIAPSQAKLPGAGVVSSSHYLILPDCSCSAQNRAIVAPAILLLKASRASKESPTAANQGVRLPLLPMPILIQMKKNSRSACNKNFKTLLLE